MKKYLILSSFALFFSCTGEKGKDRIPTFNEDIAQIIYDKCSSCHRPGSAAPFSLLTYDDVKSHGRTVELTVVTRSMPPWPADTSYSRFIGEKVLSAEEIGLISAWVKNGMPEGDESVLPSPPEFPEGSFFGKPDMVVTMTTPFHIEGNNRDHFMMMKVPMEFPADTFIRAIEIVPGNKKLVHHVNAHIVSYQEGKKKDLRMGVSSVNTEEHDKRTAYKMLDLPNDDGTYPLLIPSVSNFLPGVEPAIYPRGIGGYAVNRQNVLLLDNMHYGPSPVDTTDQTRFNIFFAPEPPSRPVKELILGTSGVSPVEPPLSIPPGEIRKFVTRLRTDRDLSLLTVNPHMHLLGVSFLAYALLPEGDTLPIIRIPEWDFRWQYFYTFPKMVKIPAGAVIVAEGVYDNTENNPLNPFHPPQLVSEREGSMRTTDEMFQLICTVLPYMPGDENISLQNEKIR